MFWHHSLMFINLNENSQKSGLWGQGKSLLKMAGEKSFWGGIENFRFCLGVELTLDDTMGTAGAKRKEV